MNDSSKLGHKITSEEKEYYALVRKAFDILAPFYNVIALPVSGVRDKVVNLANAGKGSEILDVATGTGKQAFAFAKRGYAVTGIDISEAMLRVARKKNKYENVRFKVANAINLPFSDNSFDVSCVSFALHDMPLTIREKVLAEINRVTKLQGIILIVDYALPENRISRFLIYRFIKLYEGEYYSKFIKSDIQALLQKSRIRIKEEHSVLFGAGRILIGANLRYA